MPDFRPVELVKGVKPHEQLRESYSWERKINGYIREEGDTSGVGMKNVIPTYFFEGQCFRESMHSLTNDIALEIEVKDQDHKDLVDSNVKLFWIATIRKVCGFRVLMRWVGCDKAGDERYDFWVNFCSQDVHRVGYASAVGKDKDGSVAYACPRWLIDRQTDWNEYLSKILTPMRTLAPNFEQHKRQVTKCKLQVGERVELLDNQVSTRVRPATVVRTVGRRVCLQVTSKDYDIEKDPSAEQISEERQYDNDFWVDQSSFYIFHVGWAALNGYQCCAKDSYLKHAEQIARALEQGNEPEFAGSDVRPETIVEWELRDNGAAHFDAGMKLEFLDPLDTNFNKLKVGTVVRILKDGYMIVGADGDDMENESVPFHCTSTYIFPVGYARKYGVKLVPPGGDEDDTSFDWNAYLKQTRSTAAPEHLFNTMPTSTEMASNFPIGASLEASDLNESHLICPAHVVAIRGRLIEVGYDGWGSEYNQLFDYRSNEIFPLGWCEAHGYKLEAPKEEEEPVKKKKKH